MEGGVGLVLGGEVELSGEGGAEGLGEGNGLTERLMFHAGADFIDTVEAANPTEAEQGDGDDSKDECRGCISGVAGDFVFWLDHGEGGDACGEDALECEPEGVHGGVQGVGLPVQRGDWRVAVDAWCGWGTSDLRRKRAGERPPVTGWQGP